jgi:S1-C subfamily serine protease
MEGFMKWFKYLIVFSLFVFTWLCCFQAQNLHDYYIRDVVGSKVVKIIGDKGMGTGFHVVAPSGKTYIVTNWHVCQLKDSSNHVNVKPISGMMKSRKVIKEYKYHDLCLVEGLDDAKGIKLGNEISVGQKVSLVGHPRGNDLTIQNGEYIGDNNIQIAYENMSKDFCGKGNEFIDLKPIVEEIRGRLERKESITFQDMMILMQYESGTRTVCIRKLNTNQLTTISYPGNSGSPVVNVWGNLVGVLFAGNGGAITESFIVPLKIVKDFLKDF